MKKKLQNKKYSKTCIAVGLASALFGAAYFSERTWVAFLLNSTYFLTLSVGATFFLALQYVSGSRWSEILRRIPEALGSYIPIGGLLLLVLFFGMHVLYHWSHENIKADYLNQPFFFVRLIAVIFLWFFFTKILRYNSLKEDTNGDERYRKRNVIISVFFLFIFAITFSFATFDWIMSLEPHWYSTIFAVYNFSGMLVNTLAVITLMAFFCKEKGMIRELNHNHCHDLGKLIFAFSCFWAYIWFSQLLLIWYGNIPEETIYYLRRLQHDWNWLFYTNVIINFAIPFFTLLPRSAKRSSLILKPICLLLLIGRWLDLYLMIAPGVLTHTNASIGFIEIGMTIGFAGMFSLVVLSTFRKAPSIPEKSSYLEYSLHYHQ